MARTRILSEIVPAIELDLTVEDLMHDLDPGWDNWTWTGQAAAADVAELLAVLR
jgi:hypothetical protein